MPISIAGMHRSGTSMVAKVLHLAGVYLGDQRDLMPASPDNPDGFWEHLKFVKVNDEVLNELGGGWDHVPDEAAWRDADVTQLIQHVSDLRREFEGREPWGWKDPRNSITLPFWLQIFPGMKIVICVRNPLEVAVSLYRRNFFSMALSLNLWESYNKRLLETASRTNRIVTHYETFCKHPQSELRRLATFLGLPLSDEIVEHACSAVSRPLRHNQFTMHHLRHIGASTRVVELYLDMCRQAGWTESEEPTDVWRDPGGDPPWGANRRLNLAVVEAELARRELANRDARIADLVTKLQAQTERAMQAATHTDKLTADLRKAREALEHREALADTLTSINKALQGHADLLECLVADVSLLKTAHEQALRHWAPDMSRQFAYLQQVHRIRQAVRHATPAGATLLVISKGDDELLDLYGRRGWHFPQTLDGTYAGAHSENSLSAIAQLEALRVKGADFLLFPSTAFWWLEHYGDLKSHLERRYRELVRDESCLIFDLRESTRSPQQEPGYKQSIEDVIADCASRLGRSPTILDWNSGLQLTTLMREQPVFSPPAADTALLYLDESIELVVVPCNPALLAEARRVAGAAVVSVHSASPNQNGPSLLEVEWKVNESSQSRPSASILVSAVPHKPRNERYLASVRSSLPRGFAGEITCLESESSDVAVNGAGRTGYAAACNKAAADVHGDILVFLSHHTIPIDGWLSPLVELLHINPNVGVVGGKILSAEGRIEQAGGLIYSDGSLGGFGNGEYKVDDPLYSYVRETDYCGNTVLASTRSLFEQLGGFDPQFHSAAYAHADFCLRTRERGRGVYYQPESHFVAIPVEFLQTGAPLQSDNTSATDLKLFRSRWSELLKHQPFARPWYDRDTWHVLASAGSAVKELAP